MISTSRYRKTVPQMQLEKKYQLDIVDREEICERIVSSRPEH